MAETKELSIAEAQAFLNEHVAAFAAETGPWFDELDEDAVIPLHVGELHADELRVGDMLFVHGDVVLAGDYSDSWAVDHSLVGMASYAAAFEGEAWRTMNQVVFGKPPTIDKRPREACTREAAAVTGLDGAALDALAEHFPFP